MIKRFLTIACLILIVGFAYYEVRTGGRLFTTAFAVGDLTVNWGVPEGNPIFVVSNMAPGDTETRSVGITNNAAISKQVGLKGIFDSDTDSLAGALEIVISEGATDLYGGTAGTKTLAQFFSDSSGPTGIPLFSLNSGQTKTIDFKVKFKNASGNQFQNQTLVFDIQIGISASVPAECANIVFTGSPIFGTEGRDVINASNGNHLIYGFGGNDIINSGNGDDCIVAGDGNDRVHGSNGNDVIFGGEGSDTINGNNGDDLIKGGGGNDSINGDNGNDVIYGEEGNDDIDAGNGEDQVQGDNGNDKLRGQNGNDNLNGGPGTDSARGDQGVDTCSAETKTSCEF